MDVPEPRKEDEEDHEDEGLDIEEGDRYDDHPLDVEIEVDYDGIHRRHPVVPPSPPSISVINGWSEGRRSTIRQWRDESAKTAFIYSSMTDLYEERISWLQTSSFILATLSTFLASLSFSFNEDSVAGMGIKIGITCIASIVTILTWILTRSKYENKVKDYRNYSQSVDSFNAIVSHELTLSFDMRMNAKDFINKYQDNHKNLLDEPPRNEEDYAKFEKLYNECMKNNVNVRIVSRSLKYNTLEALANTIDTD